MVLLLALKRRVCWSAPFLRSWTISPISSYLLSFPFSLLKSVLFHSLFSSPCSSTMWSKGLWSFKKKHWRCVCLCTCAHVHVCMCTCGHAFCSRECSAVPGSRRYWTWWVISSLIFPFWRLCLVSLEAGAPKAIGGVRNQEPSHGWLGYLDLETGHCQAGGALQHV